MFLLSFQLEFDFFHFFFHFWRIDLRNYLFFVHLVSIWLYASYFSFKSIRSLKILKLEHVSWERRNSRKEKSGQTDKIKGDSIGERKKNDPQCAYTWYLAQTDATESKSKDELSVYFFFFTSFQESNVSDEKKKIFRSQFLQWRCVCLCASV